MNEVNAIKLLQCLGVDNATAHGDWLRSSCPLAFHRHRAGKDSKPSFGLYIEPEGKSGYLCYSCQIRGRDLNALVWEIIYARKAPAYPPPDMDLVLAQEIIGNESDTGYTVADDWSPHPPKQEFAELPGWWLESFPSVFKFADAMSYLKKRGVPPSLWSDLELRYDTGRKMVTFPFYSMAGKLAGMRGRSIIASGSYAHHDYSWNSNNNTKLVLYNENNIDWKKPVVVVEGEFDLCKVVQYYPNAVANLTATLSAPKLETLELAVSLIGFFDNDEAGRHASQLMKHRFGYAYSEVDYGDLAVKDAGDMTLHQIQKVLAPFIV
jgi:hypothetical protein